MPTDDEEIIRARAFVIWEREGRPIGRDKDHWEQARGELGLADAENADEGSGASESRLAGTVVLSRVRGHGGWVQ